MVTLHPKELDFDDNDVEPDYSAVPIQEKYQLGDCPHCFSVFCVSRVTIPARAWIGVPKSISRCFNCGKIVKT
ncbi:MAG: hypothetical protein SWO11_16990 [Thermodesulfobacteriota bacterium]|nr:hypothetical protein [Thermodesulfobacteriota bacterium]